MIFLNIKLSRTHACSFTNLSLGESFHLPVAFFKMNRCRRRISSRVRSEFVTPPRSNSSVSRSNSSREGTSLNSISRHACDMLCCQLQVQVTPKKKPSCPQPVLIVEEILASLGRGAGRRPGSSSQSNAVQNRASLAHGRAGGNRHETHSVLAESGQDHVLASLRPPDQLSQLRLRIGDTNLQRHRTARPPLPKKWTNERSKTSAAPHRPWNFGRRFSMNAARPSR